MPRLFSYLSMVLCLLFKNELVLLSEEFLGSPVLSMWGVRLALKNMLFYLMWKNRRGARS